LAVGVRGITNAGYKKVIGKFPSLKMNTTIWWESQIERDYIYLLEIDPSVITYKGQPFCVSYNDGGTQRTYTPDFWVQRLDRQQVVEVKPLSKVNSEENLIKFRHITVECQKLGMEFVVVTDTMTRIQPKLDNIKLLYKYARCPLELQLLLECQRYFVCTEPKPLKQVCLEMEPKGISKNHLFKLLYFGFLSTDLMQPINANSLIKLNDKQVNVAELILK
jgi:hypothetical protein